MLLGVSIDLVCKYEPSVSKPNRNVCLMTAHVLPWFPLQLVSQNQDLVEKNIGLQEVSTEVSGTVNCSSGREGGREVSSEVSGTVNCSSGREGGREGGVQ